MVFIRTINCYIQMKAKPYQPADHQGVENNEGTAKSTSIQKDELSNIPVEWTIP